METRENTQTAVAEPTVDVDRLAEELAQLERAHPGIVKRLRTAAAREVAADSLRPIVEPLVDAALEREAEDHPQGVDDEAGELIEQIADLLEHTGNDFKVGLLMSLQQGQERASMTVDDNAEDETCFDAVVHWLRSQSREAKLTTVAVNVLLSHEHLLPGKNIANELLREFKHEALASDEGDFDFVVAYIAAMDSVPC